MKQLIIAAAFVLTATSAAFAQDVMAPRAMAITTLRRATAITVRRRATAIITARRRATVTTARLRHGTKTTPNAAAPARASAPAAAWASARSAKARLRNSTSAELKQKPGRLRPGFCAMAFGTLRSLGCEASAHFPRHCQALGRVGASPPGSRRDRRLPRETVTSVGRSWPAPSWNARWHSARAAGLGSNAPCPWRGRCCREPRPRHDATSPRICDVPPPVLCASFMLNSLVGRKISAVCRRRRNSGPTECQMCSSRDCCVLRAMARRSAMELRGFVVYFSQDPIISRIDGLALWVVGGDVQAIFTRATFNCGQFRPVWSGLVGKWRRHENRSLRDSGCAAAHRSLRHHYMPDCSKEIIMSDSLIKRRADAHFSKLPGVEPARPS